MEKCLGDTKNLVPMKNPLSEELTHLRESLVPNLLLSLEKNVKEFKDLKLFELEKVFKLKNESDIEEYYSLA
jgi:phenylalanyl-tRNA synthetase beta subunit